MLRRRCAAGQRIANSSFRRGRIDDSLPGGITPSHPRLNDLVPRTRNHRAGNAPNRVLVLGLVVCTVAQMVEAFLEIVEQTSVPHLDELEGKHTSCVESAIMIGGRRVA